MKKPHHKIAPPNSPRGWHERGYLPHYDGGSIPQFLTFRLADALPRHVLERWKSELSRERDLDVQRVLGIRIEKYLDEGHGSCHLRRSQIANMVQNSLLFHDGSLYRLTSWVVMPNHVHLLARPNEGVELSEVCHSIKSYTAHEANKILGLQGQFWQEEVFDRFIRSAEHFQNVISYIESNPVKARLCSNAKDWPFSSARFRAKKLLR